MEVIELLVKIRNGKDEELPEKIQYNSHIFKKVYDYEPQEYYYVSDTGATFLEYFAIQGKRLSEVVEIVYTEEERLKEQITKLEAEIKQLKEQELKKVIDKTDMYTYESVVIFNPNLPEEDMEAAINKYSENLLKRIGCVNKVDKMGIKRLAYEIKRHGEGYYVTFNFNTKPENISELERAFRIDDNVLKFMTIRIGEEGYEED